MKHKKIAVLALIFACTVLLSAAPLDFAYEAVSGSVRLIKSEYNNIKGFFTGKEYSTSARELTRAASADRRISPELSAKTHTEILPSPFNSPEKAVTAASLGTESITGIGSTPLTAREKYGYTAIPVFVDRSVGGIAAILSAHGVAYTTVTRSNTAPAGEVFAISYAGISDPSGYFINPNIAVTLYVSAQKKAKSAADGSGLVYLTFDDGPSAAHTEEILDILDEYGIKGAFFTLGTAIEANPALASSIVERGHTLGCHTMTHVYDDIYASTAALEAEVANWENALADAGIAMRDGEKIFRFPGGSVGGRVTADKRTAMLSMLDSRGYRVYDWNVSINDAVLYLAPDDLTSYEYIKESFLDSLELTLKHNEGAGDEPVIILMHESGAETPKLLKWIIESLIQRGLTFGNIANFDGSWVFSSN